MCPVVTSQITVLVLVDLPHRKAVVAEFDVTNKLAPRMGSLQRIGRLKRRLVVSNRIDLIGHNATWLAAALLLSELPLGYWTYATKRGFAVIGRLRMKFRAAALGNLEG